MTGKKLDLRNAIFHDDDKAREHLEAMYFALAGTFRGETGASSALLPLVFADIVGGTGHLPGTCTQVLAQDFADI
jgi:hypothetical protein